MSYTSLKPDIVQKLLDLKKDQSENPQWLNECQMVVGEKKKNRFLLVTECGMYIFSKPRMRQNYDLKDNESLLDLVSVKKDNNQVIIAFREKSYEVVTTEGQALTNAILKMHRYLSWNINPTTFGGINAVPYDESIPAPTSRPQHIFMHRYISSSISRKTEIEQPVLEIINKYDIHQRKSLTLQKSEITNPIPLIFAASMEPNLRAIILDNFSPNTLGSVLNWILVNPNKFVSLSLKNYETAVFKGLNARRSSFNKVNSITFYSCSSDFVQQFINAAKTATYSLESISFQKMMITDSLAQSILRAFQSYAILSSLTTIGFVDTQCELPILEFLLQVIKGKDSLKQLIVENCGIDVCQFLSSMPQTSSTIQKISLRRNYGGQTIGRDDSIPMSLLSVNVGDCEWKGDVISSFLLAVCRWSRKLPLALNIENSHFDPQCDWSEPLSHIPNESLRPVITELNASGNHFNEKSFGLFLKFLETQSPLLSDSYHLLHLSLNRCFVDDAESCFKQLISFFSARSLWGLEIQDICTEDNSQLFQSFIHDLIEIPGLTSLNICGNYLSESSQTALLKFVRDSQTIAELAVDRSSISDPDQMIYFYENLLLSPHILAFNKPIEDLKPIAHYNETKRINARLNNKRNFSTTHQRLQLYLTLTDDFSTRVVPPPYVVDESNTDALFEQNFVNPLASLFTLASLTQLDTTVDPLASMVTEYIATSGKYGIVPPTAPPPEPPQNQIELPSIFATMQLADEMDPMFDVDETATDLTQLSDELAKLAA